MKLNEFEIVFSDHFKERLEQRGVSFERVMYSLRDKIKNIRYYKNLPNELCYRDKECSIIFAINNNQLNFITAIDGYAEINDKTIAI